MSYDYYSNGNKKTEREFKANEENGKHLTYFYNGRLKDSVYTKAGKYEGKYVLYDIAGRLAGVGQFTNDYRSGNWKWYHRNGKLKEEATYTNGKLEGTVKKYYDNGKLEDESVYANDKLEGINKNYNRDGILLSELSYRKGKARAYKYFDVNGKVLAEDTESKNKINFKGYFENGNLFGEGLVENDLSQSEWKYYFASGSISSKLNYKDNELTPATRAWPRTSSRRRSNASVRSTSTFRPPRSRPRSWRMKAEVDRDLADSLVGIARKSRALRGRGLEEGISTRMLVHAGGLIADGIAVRDACRLAMTAPITDDDELLAALDGFVEAYFGPRPG